MAEQKDKVKKKRSSAQKALIQSEKRRVLNKSFRSKVKSAVRRFRENIGKNDKTALFAVYSEIASLMDKGVNKKIFKKNKASRIKARLSAYLNK